MFIIRIKNSQLFFQDFMTNCMTTKGMFVLVFGLQINEETGFHEQLLANIL